MKKINDFLRPFLAIIFGSLLFLSYLNDLSYSGAVLVMAIIWLVFAAFALTTGIISIVLGEKFPAKLKAYFELAIVSGDALLLFVEILLVVIGYELNAFSWVVAILGMASTLGFGGLLMATYFKRKTLLINLTFLCAVLFALYLLVSILFSFDGNARGIGTITLVEIALNLSYVGLASSVLSVIKPQAKKVEEK